MTLNKDDWPTSINLYNHLMNPFSSNKSLSGISITCTNIRGLGVSIKELADKKIN